MYVDGFVMAVPKARIDDYKALAEKSFGQRFDFSDKRVGKNLD